MTDLKTSKISQNTRYLIILITIIGTFYNLELNISYGSYFSEYNPNFHFFNALNTILIITLFLFSFFVNKKVIKILIHIELFLWILKLFFIKGGYGVGIGGPLYLIFEYDEAVLFLRLLLVSILYLKKEIKLHYFITLLIVLALTAHYIIYLKLWYFAMPFFIESYSSIPR